MGVWSNRHKLGTLDDAVSPGADFAARLPDLKHSLKTVEAAGRRYASVEDLAKYYPFSLYGVDAEFSTMDFLLANHLSLARLRGWGSSFRPAGDGRGT